jgi:hypothetical protein
MNARAAKKNVVIPYHATPSKQWSITITVTDEQWSITGEHFLVGIFQWPIPHPNPVSGELVILEQRP